jgi:hypothetical protein
VNKVLIGKRIKILTGILEKPKIIRKMFLSFLVGTISNVLVMEIVGQMWGVGGIS